MTVPASPAVVAAPMSPLQQQLPEGVHLTMYPLAEGPGVTPGTSSGGSGLGSGGGGGNTPVGGALLPPTEVCPVHKRRKSSSEHTNAARLPGDSTQCGMNRTIRAMNIMCIRNNLRGGVRHDNASNPFLDGLQKTFERWSADVYEKKTKKNKPLSGGHDFALLSERAVMADAYTADEEDECAFAYIGIHKSNGANAESEPNEDEFAVEELEQKGGLCYNNLPYRCRCHPAADERKCIVAERVAQCKFDLCKVGAHQPIQTDEQRKEFDEQVNTVYGIYCYIEEHHRLPDDLQGLGYDQRKLKRRSHGCFGTSYFFAAEAVLVRHKCTMSMDRTRLVVSLAYTRLPWATTCTFLCNIQMRIAADMATRLAVHLGLVATDQHLGACLALAYARLSIHQMGYLLMDAFPPNMPNRSEQVHALMLKIAPDALTNAFYEELWIDIRHADGSTERMLSVPPDKGWRTWQRELSARTYKANRERTVRVVGRWLSHWALWCYKSGITFKGGQAAHAALCFAMKDAVERGVLTNAQLCTRWDRLLTSVGVKSRAGLAAALSRLVQK